jgi:hypothetical protein
VREIQIGLRVAGLLMLAVLAGCASSQTGGGTYTNFHTKLETTPQAAPKRFRIVYGMTSILPFEFETNFRKKIGERMAACGMAFDFQSMPSSYSGYEGVADFGHKEVTESQKNEMRTAMNAALVQARESKADAVLLIYETSRQVVRQGFVSQVNVVHYELSLVDVARQLPLWGGRVAMSPQYLFVRDTPQRSGEFLADSLLIDLADKGALTGCRPPTK